MPAKSRPPDSRSRVASRRASTTGLENSPSMTLVPSAIRSVRAATNASVSSGSYTVAQNSGPFITGPPSPPNGIGTVGRNSRSYVHTEPSPAASASWATWAIASGVASSPLLGSPIPTCTPLILESSVRARHTGHVPKIGPRGRGELIGRRQRFPGTAAPAERRGRRAQWPRSGRGAAPPAAAGRAGAASYCRLVLNRRGLAKALHMTGFEVEAVTPILRDGYPRRRTKPLAPLGPRCAPWVYAADPPPYALAGYRTDRNPHPKRRAATNKPDPTQPPHHLRQKAGAPVLMLRVVIVRGRVYGSRSSSASRPAAGVRGTWAPPSATRP